MKFFKIIPAFMLSICLFFVSTFYAQSERYPKLDSLEITSFLDSIITKAIDRYNAPGAGIVIVKDSSIFFSKGYGFSDVENQLPVDPEKTLFRTASVCKTVTATVVLLARDRGLVDMNTDVNEYLSLFKVPQKFNKPITLKNLLTHTPGFDDVYIGKSVRKKEDAPPLGQFLMEFLPERVMPPGEISSYSNLGNALAAFVIEEVSGKDFEEYAVENLFKPLEMNSSSFTLQDFQKENLYKGYFFSEGQLVEFPLDHLNDYPAGQMLTPLNEFANFMIMHLNDGKFKGRQIMDSATVNEMRTKQFTHHPAFGGGSGYAFGVGRMNGYYNMSHGGGYLGISTLMYLFPEIKLGIYVVSNSSNGLPGEVCGAFFNKFLPPDTTVSKTEYPLTDLPEYDENIDRFTGKYRGTRYSRNSMTKIGVLTSMLGRDMPLWKNDEGMLMMYDHKGDIRRLIQGEPLFFQSIDDDYHINFREDEDNNITHVFTGGTSALEKIEWYEESWFNQILFMVLITIFILTLILFLVYRIIHRRDESKSLNYSLLKSASYTAGSYVLYVLVFSMIMMFLLSSEVQQIGFAYGLDWYFYVVQIIPFAAIIFTIFQITKIVKGKKNLINAKYGLTVSAVVALSSLVMVWFLNYWCLLGWRF
ncbi:MAG: beta-lactamase family protein [Melioribacteraceae bacterium]|nr:beta-lactamase family protein [Melioribacteraceae bacterium]MCF8353624.1 beta-lactamase family protein [Melioribacteraceae bacterium]MCF8393394.1 beta-lactamase family protein [Melioribacteraceae bacterium]MCF8419251.1 beta-lactamase family protein [Melioribacteraceae bacterium]